MKQRIDDHLGGIERPFSRFPGTVALGSTGRRLWADYLFPEPGFRGRFGYIHTADIRSLLTLRFEREDGEAVRWRQVTHRWHPSYLALEYASPEASVSELKFITADDVAVTLFTVKARTALTVRGRLSREPWVGGTIHGEPAFAAAACSDSGLLGSGVRLGADSPCRFAAAAAVASSAEEASRRAAWWAARANPLEEHGRQFDAWFDACPDFRCSDPYLTRMWYYRWFLLRCNMAEPASGFLQHPCFFDGRHGIVADDAVAGEESTVYGFSAFSTCNANHSLAELKWHGDDSLFRSALENFFASQPLDVSDEYYSAYGRKVVYSPPGMFVSTIRADSLAGTFHPHFIPQLVREFHQVHPDPAWLRRALPHLGEDVDAWITHLSGPDMLPVCETHGNTAMEYQPSFFYFAGYPEMEEGYRSSLEHETPLKRTDVAAFLHANLTAVGRLCLEAGQEAEGRAYLREAARLAGRIEQVLYDPRRRFFYDAHYETGEKALCEVVSGFWPLFLSDEPPPRRLARIFDHLIDEREFWTPFPAPSASRTCPVYAADNTWRGRRVHMCLWNGPVWPYADSFLARAFARAARMHRRRYERAYADFMKRFARLMFRSQDMEKPCVVEHYNPETGAPLSTEDDYLHSHFNDLIVRELCGVRLGGAPPGGAAASDRGSAPADVLTVDPLDFGLESFSLENLRYRGRRVDIASEGPVLEVFVDGKLRAGSRRSPGDPRERLRIEL